MATLKLHGIAWQNIMVASKNKEVKISPHSKPRDRDPRIKSDPDSNRRKKPAWNIGLIDPLGPWSFKQLDCPQWWDDIYSKLKNYETMTWQEIYDASGGRSHGNNNHDIPICDLIPQARRRLKELNLDDISSLFSLRLTGQQRIWGILDGNVLKLLWFDPKHQICPSLKN